MESKWTLLLFLFHLLGLATSSWWDGQKAPANGEIKSATCEKNCFYNDAAHNRTFSCSNKTCSMIPEEIPPEAKTVILESNLIKEVKTLRCEALEKIDLSDNKIKDIHPGAFQSCERLKRIDLSHNEIQSITSETFEIKLDSDLSFLDISSNHIEILGNDAFHQNLGDTLENLFINNNSIREIGDSTFNRLRRLKKLVLSSNNISKIYRNQFHDLFALRELDLNNNCITTILSNSFEDLDNLETLDLSYNEIYAVESQAFVRLDKLENLILSHNKITTLEPELFEPLQSLTDLHLDFNPIMTIYPQKFPSSMVYLSMVGLHNLQTLPDGAFANCHKLDIVHMGENPRLTVIPADAFGGKDSSVRSLNIKNNALTTLSENLLKWENVQDVDLRDNNWNCDCNLKWVKRAAFPQRNKDEMRCASPPSVAGHLVSNLKESDFICKKELSILPNKVAFRTGMLAVTTFAFFFILFAVLYKCRHKVMPCWFAKPGKYFALYNVKDVDDNSITTNGYTAQGIVKHRNGVPAPVHV